MSSNDEKNKILCFIQAIHPVKILNVSFSEV